MTAASRATLVSLSNRAVHENNNILQLQLLIIPKKPTNGSLETCNLVPGKAFNPKTRPGLRVHKNIP